MFQRYQEELLEAIRLNGWRANNNAHMNIFSTKLNEGVELVSEFRFKSSILTRLEFDDMRDRYEEIPQAHQSTFQWIYRAPEAGISQKWDNFVEWLETSTHGNLYWIAGKPGSGKSTLMKFIYDNPLTEAHLQKWADGFPLVTAGFFSWNSGTVMQMSRLGLRVAHNQRNRNQPIDFDYYKITPSDYD